MIYLFSIHRLVCYAFSIIGNYCLSSPLNVGVANLIKQVAPLLSLMTPSALQYHTRFLLSTVVHTPSSYHLCKVHVCINIM